MWFTLRPHGSQGLGRDHLISSNYGCPKIRLWPKLVLDLGQCYLCGEGHLGTYMANALPAFKSIVPDHLFEVGLTKCQGTVTS